MFVFEDPLLCVYQERSAHPYFSIFFFSLPQSHIVHHPHFSSYAAVTFIARMTIALKVMSNLCMLAERQT